MRLLIEKSLWTKFSQFLKKIKILKDVLVIPQKAQYLPIDLIDFVFE